jgi:predicted ABC-class ATPase
MRGSDRDLQGLLESLEGRSYKAYKGIAGEYAFPRFRLRIDHVQGDPFAEPSRLRVLVAPDEAALPAAAIGGGAARVAAADYLNRRFARALQRHAAPMGSGRSGELTILRPGQIVAARTSMLVHPDGSVEVRFRAGLPARGRTALGGLAASLLCARVPRAVDEGLLVGEVEREDLLAHVATVEDAIALRAALSAQGLVAFVADGALLPRRSGVDDRPLPGKEAVPFRSPDSLRVSLETPHSGTLSGMGIPEGVTLLVGGGFHGKSTLLRAIERGVYDHVRGDGRERVVARVDAVKVRAEDGRSVAGTDISNFIVGLPDGGDTTEFVTANASGSTSQAASIAEALELGSRFLLVDEDTSATNFLIRDARVQALIARDREPITPLIDRLADLRALGASLVMVVGGSGDYFDEADTVVAMDAYTPVEVTARARQIAEELPSRRVPERTRWREPHQRVPVPNSIDPSRGRREVEVRAWDADRVVLGTERIDLGAVEQIVEAAQSLAIARAIARARETVIDGTLPMAEALRAAMESIEREGLDWVDPRGVGDYAAFRIFELGAALNRLRTLRTTRKA